MGISGVCEGVILPISPMEVWRRASRGLSQVVFKRVYLPPHRTPCPRDSQRLAHGARNDNRPHPDANPRDKVIRPRRGAHDQPDDHGRGGRVGKGSSHRTATFVPERCQAVGDPTGLIIVETGKLKVQGAAAYA
jgi:hypothetical protein